MTNNEKKMFFDIVKRGIDTFCAPTQNTEISILSTFAMVDLLNFLNVYLCKKYESPNNYAYEVLDINKLYNKELKEVICIYFFNENRDKLINEILDFYNENNIETIDEIVLL